MGVSVESLLPQHGQAAGEHAKLLSDLLSAHADRMYVLGGDPARRTLCAVLREGATLDDQFQAAMHAGYVHPELRFAGCRVPTACAAFASRFVRRTLQAEGDGETTAAELVKAIAECVPLVSSVNSSCSSRRAFVAVAGAASRWMQRRATSRLRCPRPAGGCTPAPGCNSTPGRGGWARAGSRTEQRKLCCTQLLPWVAPRRDRLGSTAMAGETREKPEKRL